MLIDIDAEDARPVYRQIADEVGRAIATGILKPEDPLPAVRTLAAELKVNANTVQHAYRTLEREGVVHVRRGLGTFVSAGVRPPTRAQQAVAARRIAGRMLREAFRHGLLASDLIEALEEMKERMKGEG